VKIGLVMPLGDTGWQPAPAWPVIRELARQAEASGLDSIWAFDHLLFRYPGRPAEGLHEPWTMLAALAATTERVQLGTLVMCTAFRNPALQAKMAATLDEVSGGRLILGLGAGWHEPEFRAFGYPFDHRGGRFEEAFTIIRELLRTGRADLRGRFYQVEDCVLLPPPRRRIPLLVAARGPRLLRLTAEHADAWNAAWFGLPDERLASRHAELAAACAAAGRDPASLEVTVGLEVRFEDLLAGQAGAGRASAALGGSAEELAAGLQAHAAVGVGHAIVNLTPPTPEALARLAAGVARYREGVAA
jgi:probable F420-dependent oxidoreductase